MVLYALLPFNFLLFIYNPAFLMLLPCVKIGCLITTLNRLCHILFSDEKCTFYDWTSSIVVVVVLLLNAINILIRLHIKIWKNLTLLKFIGRMFTVRRNLQLRNLLRYFLLIFVLNGAHCVKCLTNAYKINYKLWSAQNVDS